MPSTNSKAITIKIPGLTIAGLQWGPADGVPILALHGWLDNAASFSRLAPLLDTYQVIAIDFPGHGKSDHYSPANTYHFVDGINHLLAIVNHLGWQKFILLGHSMGACIASLLAGIIPEKISYLALIEGLGPLTAPADTAAKQVMQYLTHHHHQFSSTPKIYPSLAAAAAARAKSYITLSDATLLAERGTKAVTGGVSWRHDPKLLIPSLLKLTERQTLSFLKQILAPSLLIRATDGFKYNEKEMQNRINQVKNIKVCTLKGGHHLHMESPQETARCLKNFFSPPARR